MFWLENENERFGGALFVVVKLCACVSAIASRARASVVVHLGTRRRCYESHTQYKAFIHICCVHAIHKYTTILYIIIICTRDMRARGGHIYSCFYIQ